MQKNKNITWGIIIVSIIILLVIANGILFFKNQELNHEIELLERQNRYVITKNTQLEEFIAEIMHRMVPTEGAWEDLNSLDKPEGIDLYENKEDNK